MYLMLCIVGLLSGVFATYFVDTSNKRSKVVQTFALFAMCVVTAITFPLAHQTGISMIAVVLTFLFSALIGVGLYYLGVFLVVLFLYWFFRRG
jgi:hypothetical protein